MAALLGHVGDTGGGAAASQAGVRILADNVVRLAQFGTLYGLPIVLSTVNVNTGRNQPTITPLQDVLSGIEPLDRTTINAWEDVEFNQAVKATGRNKLIMAALWPEACLSFPALDAMREGYETYPVVDAVGGTSHEAHRAALERLVQAGAKPTSLTQVACELQRDWAREETAQAFAQILFGRTGAAHGVESDRIPPRVRETAGR